MAKRLTVLLGPTGVGKTELSLQIAEELGSPIISADSRQIFREIPIGTAAPTAEEQARVKHYFVGTHSVLEDYSAGQYEADALALLEELFKTHDDLLLTGGSMMYLDAVCKGFDEMPAVDAAIRMRVQQSLQEQGLEYLQEELKRLDPEHYERVDLQNTQRVMRAVEVCWQTGQAYSSFRSGKVKQRPFEIRKIGLNRPREVLYERINHRVDLMMEQGLLEEVKNVYQWRDKNSLNTVGYKELFKYLDGEWPLDFAVNMIKQDSRHYAKRQMTWFRADKDIEWREL